MRKPVLLIVDDDRNTREGLERALKRNYDVRVAENAERALDVLQTSAVDAMLTDIRMPGMDGLSLVQRALARSPQPVCILMTAYGSIDKAVEAIKRGAADYITKPYNLDDLEIRLKKALRTHRMESENLQLHEQLDSKYGLQGIIGSSPPMQHVYDIVKQAAPTQATVLIQGASGTGKELVAHAIHRLSSRSRGPFVAVHCAALSENLMTSELFGHEKGAFTGAHERRVGRFELADGGTLFLDEASEISTAVQSKLLRVLEERCFERVGGTKTIDVDIRLIAATNRHLKELVDKGYFREDLFYRLNVMNIELPPLSERIEDLPLLCSHFISQFSDENGKSVEGLTSEASGVLAAYPWPGNVRELRNALEKMVILSRGSRLTVRDVPAEIRNAVGHANVALGSRTAPGTQSGPTSMADVERAMIESALERNGGNRTRAAEELGISRRTLHRKLKQYGAEV